MALRESVCVLISLVFEYDQFARVNLGSFSCAMAPGRNALCPCGSTKKYKQCCGAPRAASGISPSDGKASNQVANTEVQEQKKMDDEIDDFQIVSMRSTIAKSIGGAHMKPSENEIQERMRNDPRATSLVLCARRSTRASIALACRVLSSTVPFWEQAQRLSRCFSSERNKASVRTKASCSGTSHG